MNALLIGWFFAKPKHMKKYISLYKKLGVNDVYVILYPAHKAVSYYGITKLAKQFETEQKTYDQILFLDYGCISIMNNKQRELAKKMHLAQANKKSITELFKEWNGGYQLVNLVYNQSIPFHDDTNKIYDFSKITTKINMLDLSLLKTNIPPEVTLIIRSCSQLIQLLKKMRIKDNYYNDISQIINY